MNLYCRIACFVIVASVSASADVRAAAPPNVVLIISDDQGWEDYGFMGHANVRTPHLDQLAARSLVFERGYVPTPLCRPSLASIVTGRYPHQHGVVGNDVSPIQGAARGEIDRLLQEKMGRRATIPRVLAEHGYRCFQSGKWWEGAYANGGFTHGMTHGDAARGGRHGDEGLKIGRHGMRPVLNFIDESVAAKQPFFVWYAPFLPHTPHNPPERLLTKYQAPGRPEPIAKYYAMCEWFDETCGKLLGHLDEAGLRSETIVVYVCDNGWAARTDDTPVPQGWFLDFAPKSKGSCYEQGIRTPILIAWPGKVTPSRCADLASSLDLMPTILTACGLEPPRDLPGLDLLDQSRRRERKQLFGAGYAHTTMAPNDPPATRHFRWCIDGWWKLLVRDHGLNPDRYAVVHAWENIPVQLFHLEVDPHEQHNLAEAKPEVIARLRAELEAWRPTR